MISALSLLPSAPAGKPSLPSGADGAAFALTLTELGPVPAVGEPGRQPAAAPGTIVPTPPVGAPPEDPLAWLSPDVAPVEPAGGRPTLPLPVRPKVEVADGTPALPAAAVAPRSDAAEVPGSTRTDRARPLPNSAVGAPIVCLPRPPEEVESADPVLPPEAGTPDEPERAAEPLPDTVSPPTPAPPIFTALPRETPAVATTPADEPRSARPTTEIEPAPSLPVRGREASASPAAPVPVPDLSARERGTGVARPDPGRPRPSAPTESSDKPDHQVPRPSPVLTVTPAAVPLTSPAAQPIVETAHVIAATPAHAAPNAPVTPTLRRPGSPAPVTSTGTARTAPPVAAVTPSSAFAPAQVSAPPLTTDAATPVPAVPVMAPAQRPDARPASALPAPESPRETVRPIPPTAQPTATIESRAVPVEPRQPAPALPRPDMHPATNVLPFAVASRGPAAQVFAAELRRDPRARVLPDAAAASLTAPVTAPVAPGLAAPQPLDLRQEQWPVAMVDRIERLRDTADAADTSIRLVPDALGTIDVSVRQEGDTVHVHFVADQPATRAALQDAAPRLAEAADARGLKLGQMGVGGHGGDGGDRSRQPSAPPNTPSPRAVPAAAEPAADATDNRIA